MLITVTVFAILSQREWNALASNPSLVALYSKTLFVKGGSIVIRLENSVDDNTVDELGQLLGVVVVADILIKNKFYLNYV